jgi:hypothetical protein
MKEEPPMKNIRRLVFVLLALLLALPLYTALAMQAGPVSIEGWEDVTVSYGKAAKETAVKVAQNPVTGNQALCLSAAFDKENWWCDAAVLRTIGATNFSKMDSISYDVYFVPKAGTATTGSVKMQTCMNTPSWSQVPDAELTEIAMKPEGATAHVVQHFAGSAIHSQLILVAAGAGTDFAGDIYFENIVLTALPEAVAELPPVEEKLWNFDDEAAGLGPWTVEGSWEYAAGFTADNVSYDAAHHAVLLSSLAFDAAKDWSEIKLNVPLDGLSLNGYNLFSLKLIVDTAAYAAGGGTFKAQPTAIMADGSYKALNNAEPLTVTDNGDGTTTLAFAIEFRPDLDLTAQSITLGIAGANIAYAGNILVDDVVLGQKK